MMMFGWLGSSFAPGLLMTDITYWDSEWNHVQSPTLAEHIVIYHEGKRIAATVEHLDQLIYPADGGKPELVPARR